MKRVKMAKHITFFNLVIWGRDIKEKYKNVKKKKINWEKNQFFFAWFAFKMV
jgi:hypothetical protein